jgi:hypothetical protein
MTLIALVKGAFQVRLFWSEYREGQALAGQRKQRHRVLRSEGASGRLA